MASSVLLQDPPAAPGLRADVLRLIEHNRLACEYQPIVRVANQELWAYEALARFSINDTPVAPNLVFDALHTDRTRFFMLESRSKRFQLQHRPAGARLFVNLDPHVCEVDYHLEHWLGTFAAQDELVVEIIENTSESNLDAVRGFTEQLRAAGIDVALDDVGGHRNFFSFDLLDHCQVIKLDRHWLLRFEQDAAYIELVAGMLAFARSRGIHSVLEGVETQEDLRCAESLGVDFVQGFLFREHFQLVQDTAAPVCDRPAAASLA